MPTCPNCGEIVMNGDPYCSHCGATFKWNDLEEDEDDYDFLRREHMVKRRIENEIQNENYREGLLIIRDHPEFDLSDCQKIIRQHYIKLYKEDYDIGIFDEYVNIMPDDIYFLSMIAVIERHHGDLVLIDVCNDMIDRIENGY